MWHVLKDVNSNCSQLMVLQKTTAEITKLQVATNETVKHCYRPLVSDCAFEGRLANEDGDRGRDGSFEGM